MDALELTSSLGNERILRCVYRTDMSRLYINQTLCNRIPHPELAAILPYLVAYETSTQMARFSQTSYSCQICLTSIKGARCFLLSCSHVFCRACLEDFWKLCIAEGDISRVGCPDPKCVKEGREANEEEVRRVVSEEEVRRWKWLRQKQMLERGMFIIVIKIRLRVHGLRSEDPGMVHCPMSVCQTPVPKPPNVDELDGTGWDRLRTCPQCNYSFCVYCKRTWCVFHKYGQFSVAS